MYQVVINHKLGRKLAKYPSSEQKKIKKTLDLLQKNPLPKGKDLKKLQGQTHLLWRLRIGNWRIIYAVHPDDKIIQVVNIDLRGNIY